MCKLVEIVLDARSDVCILVCMSMTRKKINEAIKHLGIEVAGKAGDGCYYFLDLETGHAISQAEPVYIGSMSHLNQSQWIEEAESAAKIRDEIVYLDTFEHPAIVILRPKVY